MLARYLARRPLYSASSLVLFSILLNGMPALAEDAQPKTPEVPQVSVPAAAPGAQAPAAQTGANAATSSAPLAPGEQASGSGNEVSPGPLLEKRRALFQRLMQARDKGIGITNYLAAFKGIEESAKTGESEESLGKRLDSLGSSLSDQLKRSVILKTQKLPPPIAASSPPPSAGASGASGGSGAAGASGLSSTDGNDLLARLKGKYGDHVPDAIKDKLPGGIPSDPSKLLSDPNIRDLIKGLKKN